MNCKRYTLSLIKLMAVIGVLVWAPAARAQKILDVNLKQWVETIPVVPVKAHEVHSRFSMPSADGDRFADAHFLNPVYNQAVDWLSEIHGERIEKRISENRNREMTYAVQFDDERLRLALRPLIGKELGKKYGGKSAEGVQLLQQLVALEAGFDFMKYYRECDKIDREQMALDAEWNSLAFELEHQIPMVQTEWGLQKDDKKQKEVSERLAKLKIKNDTYLFTKRQQAWTAYFHKYSSAVDKLEQVLGKVQSVKALWEDPVFKTMVSEVQARALEAMEKMIWKEYALVAFGELLFQDERILKGYLVEKKE